jgi:hypothetical protein
MTDPACSECHHLFNSETGEYIKGWENVYIVTPGPLLCRLCKESIIETLEKGVPV